MLYERQKALKPKTGAMLKKTKQVAMLKKQKRAIMLKKNKKGQVAIFLLMIFQLLFVLFAMTINIALTVHDKINLQNSVDLAALYGAKKQAEVLNAIAHINFQMRQSYKLLAWRFRILSTVTVVDHRDINNEWCPQNRYIGKSGQLTGSCESRYAACFSADLWGRGIKANRQNLCRNQAVRVEDPPEVELIFSTPWNAEASNRQMRLRDNMEESCNGESFINWLMTQVFLSHFRLDQKDRKMMIHAIYEASLKQGLGLAGESIKAGVESTLQKNLTFTNRRSDIDFKVFNSLQDPSAAPITDFLEPQNVFPVLEFLFFGGPDDACSNDDPSFSNQDLYPSKFDLNDEIIKAYIPYVNSWKPLFDYNQSSFSSERFISPLTLSYKKKPDFTVYYGVSVKLTQSRPQLFAPSSSLELKASAFAKPFGGRIGPKTIDPLALTPKPNYSRYPGDTHGLRDQDAHRDGYYLNKHEGDPHGNSWQFYDVNNYSDLASRDALATNTGPDFVLRLMELMAISPNIYDLLNYSISNNYMKTYFPKISGLIGGTFTAPGATVPGYIRGDFGPYSHYDGRNQSITVSSFVPFYFFPPGGGLNYWTTTPSGFEGTYGYNAAPPIL